MLQPLAFRVRPNSLEDIIGQEHLVKENGFLYNSIKAETPISFILYGTPGVGKTTIAIAYAKSLKINYIKLNAVTSNKKDIEKAIEEAKNNTPTIVIIDEIHRLNKVTEEILYPAMEDYRLDIIIGSGPAAQTIKIDLPKFTLIGATTRAGMLSNPLRDRFGMQFRLEFYKDEELAIILQKAALKLNKSCENEAALEIAKRSRSTPRIALRLLKRVRDFADVNDEETITKERAKEALNSLGVNELGFDAMDLRYLELLTEAKRKPIGLSSIAAALSEDENTIEDVIEPYLLANGYIERTAKGRIASTKSFSVLKLNYEQTLFDEN